MKQFLLLATLLLSQTTFASEVIKEKILSQTFRLPEEPILSKSQVKLNIVEKFDLLEELSKSDHPASKKIAEKIHAEAAKRAKQGKPPLTDYENLNLLIKATAEVTKETEHDFKGCRKSIGSKVECPEGDYVYKADPASSIRNSVNRFNEKFVPAEKKATKLGVKEQ
jgi:hypothetical protein